MEKQLNYYYELAEEVTPRLEKLIQLPVPRNVEFQATNKVSNYIGQYRLEDSTIFIQQDVFQNLNADWQSSVIGHELVHATQFHHFPHLRQFYLQDFRNLSFVERLQFCAIDNLIEGDATYIERKLLQKLKNRVYHDLCQSASSFLLTTFLGQNSYQKLPRYVMGKTTVSSLDAEFGRSAINSLYELPIEHLASTMQYLLDLKYPEEEGTFAFKAIRTFFGVTDGISAMSKSMTASIGNVFRDRRRKHAVAQLERQAKDSPELQEILSILNEVKEITQNSVKRDKS